MKKTAEYLTRCLYLMVMTTIGLVWILTGVSCEKTGLTRSIEWDEDTEITEDSVKVDDQSGISFELESDTLKEEIEEVRFQAKEWEESLRHTHILNRVNHFSGKVSLASVRFLTLIRFGDNKNNL